MSRSTHSAGVIRLHVNADGNPSQDTISDAATEEDVVNKRIVGRSGLGSSNAIGGVLHQRLLVGSVRAGSLYGGDERLVEEDLSDVMRDAVDVGVVVVDGGVRGGLQMDVDGTAGVVAWENGVELHDAFVIALLHTAAVGGIEASLSGGRDARVDAQGVAVPGIDEHVRSTRAGVDIDELDVQVERHAGLAVGDIFTDQFASNPVRTDGDLGDEHAGSVLSKDGGWVRGQSVAGAGLVGKCCVFVEIGLGPASERS